MAFETHPARRKNGQNQAAGQPRASGRPPVRNVRLIFRGAQALILVPGVFLVAACCFSIPGAQAQSPSEYQVKAAFLYNFAKFVEWPQEALDTPDEPFVVGIVGEDPFAEILDQTLDGKTVNGRTLIVRRFRKGAEARACRVLFISSSERKRLASILRSLEGASVLTIGESEGFVAQGGVIKFTLEENRVHFEINVEAAERVRLKISSRLLRLAKIFPGQGPAKKG